MRGRLALGLLLTGLGLGPAGALDQRLAADTALVLSVDVSNSVDEHRFRLQMEGIAAALEDPAVERALTAGGRRAILISLVQWADRPTLSIPWVRITSLDDARRLAATVRNLQRRPGDFTCVAGMLHFVEAKVLTALPGPADRIVVDVSGDGQENCNPAVPPARERDRLIAADATINGLPILEGGEKDTLKGWYEQNVAGGEGAFVLPADGFKDFGRAIRQKFITEISAR